MWHTGHPTCPHHTRPCRPASLSSSSRTPRNTANITTLATHRRGAQTRTIQLKSSREHSFPIPNSLFRTLCITYQGQLYSCGQTTMDVPKEGPNDGLNLAAGFEISYAPDPNILDYGVISSLLTLVSRPVHSAAPSSASSLQTAFC